MREDPIVFERAGEKSKRFAGYYEQFAGRQGCRFLDASRVTSSSDVDGIHLESTEHRKLGEAITIRVGEVFA